MLEFISFIFCDLKYSTSSFPGFDREKVDSETIEHSTEPSRLVPYSRQSSDGQCFGKCQVHIFVCIICLYVRLLRILLCPV